jgi:hypothetical protein
MKHLKLLALLAITLVAQSCAFNSDPEAPVAGNVSAIVGGRSVFGVEVDLLGRRVGAGVWMNPKDGE